MVNDEAWYCEHRHNDDARETFLSNVGLTQEQYETIESRLHINARELFVGRNLTPINNIGGGIGTEGYVYYTLAEVGDAVISDQFDAQEDIAGVSRTVIPVPIIHRPFRIPARSLKASKTQDTPLDLSTIDSARFAVAHKEDEFLINGWAIDATNYKISGLYQAANNTVAGGTWATGSNIVANTLSVMAALLNDNIYPPYNLTLHPDQWVEAHNLISNTGISYAAWIKEIINVNTDGMTGKIYMSKTLATGTGMMTKAGNHTFFEYELAEDMAWKAWIEDKTEDMVGRVFIVGTIAVKDTNSICTLTGI